jgi:hypothetical protein
MGTGRSLTTPDSMGREWVATRLDSEETMAEILLLGISHYPPLSGHRMIAPPG